jgi:hypothetical protein
VKTDKKDEESDVSSDSHNTKEELEKEKMYEFTEMVTQCIEEEEKRRTYFSLER